MGNIFNPTPEELQEALDTIAREKVTNKGDPRVCICGHSARSHSSQARPTNLVHRSIRDSGQDRCLSGRQACPCDGFRGMVTTKDVRVFRFRTQGAFNSHALYKGIIAARTKGHEVEPIGEWRCDFCERTDNVGPVPVNKFGKEVAEPGLKNFLMCPDHVSLLRRGELFSRSA